MDGGQSKDTDAQFISFHDFPSISHAGNSEGQLVIGASTHQPFNNLPNDSMGIVEDLQEMPDKTAGVSLQLLAELLYFVFLSVGKYYGDL